jgi:hypothetical protein
MRTYEEYREILELWQYGLNKKQIAVLMGIPRPTVRDCINRYKSLDGLDDSPTAKKKQGIQSVVNSWSQEQRRWYSYLLAVYLGDGYICLTRKTFRLRLLVIANIHILSSESPLPYINSAPRIPSTL